MGFIYIGEEKVLSHHRTSNFVKLLKSTVYICYYIFLKTFV